MSEPSEGDHIRFAYRSKGSGNIQRREGTVSARSDRQNPPKLFVEDPEDDSVVPAWRWEIDLPVQSTGFPGEVTSVTTKRSEVLGDLTELEVVSDGGGDGDE